MKKRQSFYKNPKEDHQFLEDWVSQLEIANGYAYKRIELETGLGKTIVWGINTEDENLESLLIFPGARTSVLFWDFDQGLSALKTTFRLYLVETNGQPNLSDGYSPDIKGLDYGHWAAEVIEKLGLKQVYISGASFGGLVCMKLCITHPDKVKAAILLNPGCFRLISLSWQNLSANLKPIITKKKSDVAQFLDKVVFNKPNHKVSPKAEKMVLDYECHAIFEYKDHTQKPYNMGEQLELVQTDTYLIVGDRDIMFPAQSQITQAKQRLGENLKDIIVLKDVGHGIETYHPAIELIETIISKHKLSL